MVFNWTAPNPFLGWVPWLVVLGLLLFKPNRRMAALWVCVPLACGPLFESALRPALQASNIWTPVLFAHVFVPLVFGLAAVWLIPWHQFAKPRWLLLLSALLACEGFSLGSLRALLKPGVDFWQPGMLYTLLAASAVSLCLAVWWTGLSCRRRPGLERFLPLLAAWQAVSWAITIMLFCVCVGEAPSLRELLPILGGFIFVYVVSLPFVILGLASPFYRERLQALLDLAPTTPAPAPVPPQAANQAPSIPS